MGVPRSIIAAITAASTAGCGVVLGIDDVPAVDIRDAGKDHSIAEAGSPERDASKRDGASMVDGRRDARSPIDAMTPHDAGADAEAAAVCVPVSTPEAGLSEGACPGPSDASDAGTCVPTSVNASALTWIPPVARRKVCTTQEIQSLFSPVVLNSTCFNCLVSYVGTGLSAFGATIDFPQITYAVYGFPSFGGCIATLEPCNLACAQAVQAADLCINEACLSGCPDTQSSYAAFQACVNHASQGCPCGALSEAANTCVAEIAARGSPAMACIESSGTGNAAYEAQVEAIGAILCGGLDGGADAP
jgi:hypothetical protein